MKRKSYSKHRSQKASKPKSGRVYFGTSVRKDGSKKEYVGSTTRSVKVRESEHKREVQKKDSKSWVGKGTDFKVTGSIPSQNPRKAERTIKRNKAQRSINKWGKKS